MGLTVTVTSSDQLYNRKRPRITAITARDRLCAVNRWWLSLHSHVTFFTTLITHPSSPHRRPHISYGYGNLTKHHNAKVGARLREHEGGEGAKGKRKSIHGTPAVFYFYCYFYSNTSANRRDAEGSSFSFASIRHARMSIQHEEEEGIRLLPRFPWFRHEEGLITPPLFLSPLPSPTNPTQDTQHEVGLGGAPPLPLFSTHFLPHAEDEKRAYMRRISRLRHLSSALSSTSQTQET